MTAKYNLIKLYENNAEISVIASSLENFLTGNRTTIDHIVMYYKKEIIVRAKPIILDYKKYKPEEYHFSPNESLYILPQ